MKLAVVGSRSWWDWDYFEDGMRPFKSKTELVISGGAHGPDSMAEWWAFKNRIPCRVHIPDWKQFGRSAGKLRNKDIVGDADNVIAFQHNSSTGTAHSISLAAKYPKPCKVFSSSEIPAQEINIRSNSESFLEAVLSNFASSPMEINGVRIESLEGYWHYLKSGRDQYLSLPGWKAKQLSKNDDFIVSWEHVDRAQFIKNFLPALKIKIDRLLAQGLDKDKRWQDTSIPLAHYFVSAGGLKQYQPNSWWLYFLEDIRRGKIK